MILFDLTLYEFRFDKNDTTTTDGTKPRPYEYPNLSYRADDDQRTIMSGQILLRGMFGDLIQQHSLELDSSQSDPVQ